MSVDFTKAFSKRASPALRVWLTENAKHFQEKVDDHAHAFVEKVAEELDTEFEHFNGEQTEEKKEWKAKLLLKQEKELRELAEKLAVPEYMNTRLRSLERGADAVQQWQELEKKGAFLLVDQARTELIALSKIPKGGFEISKGKKKGTASDEKGRSRFQVAAACKEALASAEDVLRDVEEPETDRQGIERFRGTWASFIWEQIEDIRDDFEDAAEDVDTEKLRETAERDFQQASIWLNMPHMFGDEETAAVRARHDDLEDPVSIAEVLAKWDPVRFDVSLGAKHEAEWEWVKHQFEEALKKAALKKRKVLVPSGLKEGDAISWTYGNGVVVRVFRDTGTVFAQEAGKRGITQVSMRDIKAPAVETKEPPSGLSPKVLLRSVLQEVAVGHPMDSDEQHEAFDVAKGQGLVTGRSDGRSELTGAGLAALWELGGETLARGTTNVRSGARNTPEWQKLVDPKWKQVKLSPEARFTAMVKEVTRQDLRVSDVDWVTKKASRRLIEQGDKEAASGANLYWHPAVQGLTGEAMIQAGATPAWALSFDAFQQRQSVLPGMASVPSSETKEEEAARAAVQKARLAVEATKEGKKALESEAYAWSTAPTGKAAAAAWVRYKAARAHLSDVEVALRPYHQWVIWMASRRQARAAGHPVPTQDESSPVSR